MRLSGSEYQELTQALLDAFDAATFARMLRVELDKSLNNFASDKVPLPGMVEAVIAAAEQEDWTKDLVLAAARFNPGNRRLGQLAAEWEFRESDAAEAETTQPSITKANESTGIPAIWMVVAVFVALFASGFGIWLLFGGKNNIVTPESVPPTTTGIATPIFAATQASQDTSEAPSLTPTMPSVPALPDFAPPLTTTVVLVSTPQCAVQLAELNSFLTDATATMTPSVELLVVETADRTTAERADVRALGAANGADLAIWCTEESESGIELHFELISHRSTPEVFEPTTISLPVASVDRSQKAALGTVNYMRRDYVGAAPLLRTVIAMSQETGAEPLFTLLVGNSQVFLREYRAAVSSYGTVVEFQPGWAQAWNNLGVAELNDAWETEQFDKAITAFNEAIRLDPEYMLPFVGLGRIYRLTLDTFPENLEKAYSACAQAEQSNDPTISVQGQFCRNQTMMKAGWDADAPGGMPEVKSKEAVEEAATPFWAEPFVLLGMIENAYWRVNQDPLARQQAIVYFARYLGDAYDDVHLEESRSVYTQAAAGYEMLQQEATTP